jgi:hypothetical protein
VPDVVAASESEVDEGDKLVRVNIAGLTFTSYRYSLTNFLFFQMFN